VATSWHSCPTTFREPFEVYWAARRSGLYITAVNSYLTPDEVA